MRLMRLSILGVALFGFAFSLLFPLKDYIMMYFAITSAIYLGGAGAVIIGGLYWKRGTTAAAWVAMIIGSCLSFGGLMLQQVWSSRLAPLLQGWFPESAWLAEHSAKFPLNGQIIYLLAMLGASSSYVLVSLLGPRQAHDMDKLLHRGKYAIASDAVHAADGRRQSWTRLIGLTPELNRRERWLVWTTFCWSMGWWGIFLTGIAWNALWGTTDNGWSWYWWFKVWLSFGLGIVLTVWMLIGGLRDAATLMADLRSAQRNEQDDGTVDHGPPALALSEVDQ